MNALGSKLLGSFLPWRFLVLDQWPPGSCLSSGGGQDRKSQAQSHVVAYGISTCIMPAHLLSPKTTHVSVPHMDRGKNKFLLNSNAVSPTEASEGKKGSRQGVWLVTSSFIGCLLSCSGVRDGRSMLDSWLPTYEQDFMTHEL